MSNKLLPAIRGKIGEWRYYTSILTFEDINYYVKKIDDELHESRVLSDLIQRSITDNYKNIKEYIITQDERFFNSLVLAIYDGDPEWIEVELNYDNKEFFNMGFLKLNGKEKIFPIDGQHRVEGIKSALSEKASLKSETIPVLFIGHSKTSEGMERSRRLFSTLNRYAKPVSMRDIIALDEDDIVAIATRKLIEVCNIFKNDRILDSTEKSISDNNDSLTTIIALYDCNKEIFKYYKNKKGIKGNFQDFLKKRPNNEIIEDFSNYCIEFWGDFENELEVIQDFLENGLKKYRNNESGGNLLFRPTGLCIFVKAILEIAKQTDESFKNIIKLFNEIDMSLDKFPWNHIFWDDKEKHIISGNNATIKLILIYLYDRNLLKESALKKIKDKFKNKNDELESL